MFEKRLEEIKARKAEIRALLKDSKADINLEEINKELDNLNAEKENLEERAKIAEGIEAGEINPDSQEKVPGSEEGGDSKMPKEEKKFSMSKEVRSFLKYMMTGGRETRGVTLENGQAVVPSELDDEIITEMREVSDVLNFINLKNVRGTLRVGNITAIKGNKDNDGEEITQNGGTTGEVTFGSYRTSAKIELGVGLDYESMEAFKDIIVSELALALSLILEGQVMTGTGTNEAEGLFTKTLPEEQKMTVEVASFGHKTLAALKGKIRRAYGKRASYVINTETFHEQIEGMVDQNGRPIYDTNTETLLKKPVVISDEAPKNKILFGYGKRYWYNYNMPPQIASSEHEKFSEGLIVHRALAFGDGHMLDTKAFAVLEITGIDTLSDEEIVG